AGLNWLAPGYYPGVFPFANQSSNAPDVGIATAVLQGVTLGLVVGAVVAFGLGWFGQLRLAPSARSVAVVALWGVVFAFGGTLIGYLLGVFAPGYYQTVVGGGRQQDFKPVDVGIGLGCSEGLMLGVVVGTVTALVVAWREWRVTKKDKAEAAD